MVDLHLAIRRETASHSFSLSLTESQLLSLASENEIQVKGLTQCLSLDKSTISRTLSGLSAKGLLSATEVGREKVYCTTQSGLGALKADDGERSDVTRTILKELSSKEVKQLLRFFSELADSLGVAPDKSRPSEHPLRPEQRRLAKGFGTIGDNLFDSGLSAAQFHTVDLLFRKVTTADVTGLTELLPFDQSTLSRAVQTLARRGVVVKRAGEDKRGSLLRLGASGQRLYSAVREKVVSKLEEAWTEKSRADVLVGVELLRKALNGDAQRRFLGGPYSISICTNEAERQMARSVLIKLLVSEGLHHMATANLAGEGSEVIILSRESKLCGVIQIDGLVSSTPSLSYLLVDSTETPITLRELFLYEGCSILTETRDIRNLRVRMGAVPERLHKSVTARIQSILSLE